MSRDQEGSYDTGRRKDSCALIAIDEKHDLALGLGLDRFEEGQLVIVGGTGARW
jgi:hypothetical protein